MEDSTNDIDKLLDNQWKPASQERLEREFMSKIKQPHIPAWQIGLVFLGVNVVAGILAEIVPILEYFRIIQPTW